MPTQGLRDRRVDGLARLRARPGTAVCGVCRLCEVGGQAKAQTRALVITR